MAIKLLRESSETPNISNKDDVKMARYAYGGYDGVMQKYGEELSASVSLSSLHIGSGRAVVNGWEVDIDGAGVDLDFSLMPSGVFYYTVYLEVNAELETAQVKTLYDLAEYPRIDPGDDLTEAQSGTARMTLYHFTLSKGTIIQVEPQFVLIPYGKQNFENLSNAHAEFKSGVEKKFDSLEERLSRLGFREGSCIVTRAQGTPVNSLKRQGNYVLMNLTVHTSLSSDSQFFTVEIPQGFRPPSGTKLAAVIEGRQSYEDEMDIVTVSDGKFFSYLGNASMVDFFNQGWETADP